MSSVDTVLDLAHNDECGMNNLPAHLNVEICSYLEVHDQLSMRKVCKSWRSCMSQVLLSDYVDLDISKIPNKPETKEQFNHSEHSPYTAAGIINPLWLQDQQRKLDHRKYYAYFEERENLLEKALKTHLQRNTKILILRHVAFERLQMGIVAKVIKETQTDLIQLILKDCRVQEKYLISPHWSLNCQGFTNARMTLLFPATRRLLLDNYTIRSLLDAAKFDPEMPCSIPAMQRIRSGYMSKKLPIVLPRFVFDCSQPFGEQYPSYILALDANCPELSPEMRDEVVQLYKSWVDSDAEENQWRALSNLIKCLNGVPVHMQNLEVDVAALRQLDPLTLNKLTIHALHRLYCLPADISPLPFTGISFCVD